MRAGIHRGDQDEICGKNFRSFCAGDAHHFFPCLAVAGAKAGSGGSRNDSNTRFSNSGNSSKVGVPQKIFIYIAGQPLWKLSYRNKVFDLWKLLSHKQK